MKQILRIAGIEFVALAAAAVLIVASSPAVRAQVILSPDKIQSDVTTPEKLNALIHDGARAQQARGTTAARYGRYIAVWPKDGAEFDKLAGFTVVLVTVTSQTQAELPLKRAYLVTANGVQTPLRRLSNWRSSINRNTLAYKQLGKFREDGFYLIPAVSLRRAGEMQLDFAINRVGFVLMHLPTTEQKLSYEPRDPSPGAEPNSAALRSMIQREYPGFPLPKL